MGTPIMRGFHGVSATIEHEVRRLVPNGRVFITSGPGRKMKREEEEDDSTWKLVKRIAEHEPGSRGAQHPPSRQ
jgi:hypothetical protein